METFGNFSAWFWDAEFWFPAGFTWEDIQTPEKYPDHRDLAYPLFYAVIISCIRVLWEWSIARPFGIYVCGIEDVHSELYPLVGRLVRWWCGPDSKYASYCPDDWTKSSQSPTQSSSSVKTTKHQGLGSKVHLVPRKSTLDKFCESSWRGLYYSLIFIYGVVILYEKTWFWETTMCWYGWPFQDIDKAVWWYYMIEAGFYWSLAFSQFVDVQRKDFWVNFIHHIATILLIYLSWMVNFVRLGALVLVVHDAADAWMEAAKMARYAKRDLLCNVLFAIFALIWFGTRVYIYPYKVIYCCMVESVSMVGFCGSYYIFNSLMILLLVLHVFWSVLILRIAIGAVLSGEADDVRSDDEEVEEMDNSVGNETWELSQIADFDFKTLVKTCIDVVDGFSNKIDASSGNCRERLGEAVHEKDCGDNLYSDDKEKIKVL